LKQAVFNIGYAGCLNCKRAIEHAGKHIKGIKDIGVNIENHEIIMVYDESKAEALDELKDIVRKIGYEAELVKNTDINEKL
jgi:cation transport ATPase